MSLSPEQEAVLQLLRRYGWNTTSFQVLEPGYRYWLQPDAAIAYIDTGTYWLGAGAPICEEARLGEVADAFRRDAEAASRKAAFFGAGTRLVNALPQHDALQVGVEACWDPREWSTRLGSSSQVASQVRRAARKGLTVQRVPPEELTEGAPLRQLAEMLMRRWLAQQPMAPLGFLAHLDPFSNAEARRYYRATREGRLVGLLVLIPIYARGGWFLEDLLYDPRCPPGTTETLIDAAMRDLEQEGVPYASMGMVALAGLPRDPNHPHLYAILRACYNSLNWLYGFRGLQAFRAKFKPAVWEPVYLVGFERIRLLSVLHVLKAFAGGRLDRFAAESLAKGLKRAAQYVPEPLWSAVPTTLAVMLVPWIGLLLWADSTRWFGAEWLSRAWAAFDVPVAVSFGAMGYGVRHQRGWVRPLSTVLLGVVLADSWLTLWQALLYNLPHAASAWERLVAVAAVAAPTAASAFLLLWRAGRGDATAERT